MESINFVRVERAKRKLSQVDLARRSGITQYKIFRSEKENNSNILTYFNYEEIEKLAKAFDMSVDELVKLYRTEYEEKGEN